MPDDTPELVVQARNARDAIEAIIRLTIAGRGGLRYPSELGDVVSALARAAYGLRQALPQLGRIAADIADDPGLYDDRGAEVWAPETAWSAARLLDAAEVGGLADLLARAAGHLAHLGVRDA